MVLGSAQHLARLVLGRCRVFGHSIFTTDLHMVAIRQSSTSALATSASCEANVGVTRGIKHTTITVGVVASGLVVDRRLPEGNRGLENRALHVVDEDSHVARGRVANLAAVAVIRSRILGRSVGVFTVTTGLDVVGVNSTTSLQVGPVVHTIADAISKIAARENTQGPKW